MQAKVKANWNPPSAHIAKRLRKKPVEIKLTLTKQGYIIKSKIISSSGSKAMDQSVLKAIRTLKATITPPQEDLEFIVDFNLY